LTTDKKKITLDLSPAYRDELVRLAKEQGQTVTDFVVSRIRRSGFRAFAKED
jgi:uncharacterized protein (DUF1778 family)